MDAIQSMAESSTGIKETVKQGGQFYDSTGEKISDTKAKKLFREGSHIEVPNAGAGSYKAILNRLGFTKVEVEDWTSSAGDWTFKVHGGFVFQSNRYPCCGFEYSFLRI